MRIAFVHAVVLATLMIHKLLGAYRWDGIMSVEAPGDCVGQGYPENFG